MANSSMPGQARWLAQPRSGTPSLGGRRRPRALLALTVTLGLLALGCGARPTPTPPPTSEVPPEIVSPTPGDTVLLELSGSGDQSSDEFRASGESVAVDFAYECASESSFTINFYGTGPSPLLPEILTDEFGSGRSDSTIQSLNSATGPFRVEIVTQCDWEITVLGTP